MSDNTRRLKVILRCRDFLLTCENGEKGPELAGFLSFKCARELHLVEALQFSFRVLFLLDSAQQSNKTAEKRREKCETKALKSFRSHFATSCSTILIYIYCEQNML